eukprot:6798561-Alexandrium_andersonii.AAC.1
MASHSLLLGVIVRVPVAVVGTTKLCNCNERRAHMRWGRICTSKGPNCSCVRLQPRTSCSAPGGLLQYC